MLGADLIAGFPTETDEMFKQTIDLISDAELLHLHIFPLLRKNRHTRSKMPQVTSKIKKMRAIIKRSGAELVAEHLSKELAELKLFYWSKMIQVIRTSFSQ